MKQMIFLSKGNGLFAKKGKKKQHGNSVKHKLLVPKKWVIVMGLTKQLVCLRGALNGRNSSRHYLDIYSIVINSSICLMSD